MTFHVGEFFNYSLEEINLYSGDKPGFMIEIPVIRWLTFHFHFDLASAHPPPPPLNVLVDEISNSVESSSVENVW